VVAIMAIVMGILGLSLRSMQGPSTQVAAAQVASGLSFARQLAVSRNAETRFVIFGSTAGVTGPGLPPENWRYWSVLVTNKNIPNPADNLWIMQKEWEKLPEGTVFLNVASANYSTINTDPIGATLGQPFRPTNSTTLGSNNEWQGFVSYGDFKVSTPSSPNTTAFQLTQVPVIGFRGTGEAVECQGTSRGVQVSGAARAIAARVADGSSTAAGEIILRSVENYYYVETDMLGRVRVRARESYR